MSINRPTNINKRLTGTPNRTPGNAGQIGPVKTPYCITYNPTATLGERYCGGGCCCPGVFRITESYCGRSERCNLPAIDFGGNIFYKSGGYSWVVSPIGAEVSRNWFCRTDSNILSQSITGCTGWFVPSCAQIKNQGYAGRSYWDAYTNTTYWTDTSRETEAAADAYFFDVSTGVLGCGTFANTGYSYKTAVRCVRSFRCVVY